ncbi:Uncharacterized protein FWK35_00013759, partial [Aphis craccivora]
MNCVKFIILVDYQEYTIFIYNSINQKHFENLIGNIYYESISLLIKTLNSQYNINDLSKKYKLPHDTVSLTKTFVKLRNSERSEECIDFTMMCVFFVFVSVYSITSRNNTPISNYGGGFR